MAIIIGRETKRLLFLGIRNKYCSTCSIAHNCNKSVPPHKCYKNWTESSCAMESDILVEGFRASEATHGVRYMEVIGDGDSSVLAAIRSQVIWGPYVLKLECANHACKNYRAKLEAIVHDNPRFKGRGGLTQKVIRRLTAAARAAIRMHSTTRNINQLRQDLRNAPFHVFGDHTNCSPSFCKACSNRQDDVDEPVSEVTAIQPDGDEREIIPESENDTHISISDKMLDVIDEELRTEQHQLRDENEARFCAARITDVLPTGLLTKVLAASDRIVSLAPQLVNNVTSNLAETYMGIRTYFDGGKLFNRVQSGSFEATQLAYDFKMVLNGAYQLGRSMLDIQLLTLYNAW